MTLKKKLLVVALSAIQYGTAFAASDDRARIEELHETTLSLIRLLVEQGVLKQEAADAMLAKAQQQAADKVAQQKAAETEAVKGVVRVTYIPEHVRNEIREQIREKVVAQAKQERWGDINAVPEWLDRLKWEGDIRLRYQADLFGDGNAPAATFQSIGQDIDNTTETRHRERVRLRLGLNANVVSGVDAGIRITTGNTSDPVSTNQTLGNTGNKYSVVLDRAFLKLTPLEELTVSGGRIPNPFFGTDLVWDDDLAFEGVAATWRPWPSAERVWRPYVTAGIFPLQEIDENGVDVRAEDKWLYGLQGGAEWMPDLTKRVKIGLSYYDYRNVAGIPNPALGNTFYDKTAPQFRQKGNSLFNIDNDGNPATNLWALAADYRIVNLTLVGDYAWQEPLHVIGSFDWARNVGFDRGEILARTGQDIEPEIDGYQAKLTFGYPNLNEFEKWQVFLGYRYLERDAVLDAFTDSDFHLGGTNAKGFFIGGSYGLYKNTWLSARWMSADEISGLPLAIDVFQL
ncbi:MAG: putative porin, partial [Hydrogenophilaceae bacterium]|nr:putative porin [Hydrogenophilaceae bacterium]